MASMNQYSLIPLDTSLLRYSGAQDLLGVSPANAISDLSFSLYLQTVIDRLNQAQKDALSSVNNYTTDKTSANMDEVITQLNLVNGSLRDMLLMRTQMMQAYQNINSLGF